MSKLQEPPQSFLFTIAVLEGRHYVWPEMTSFVQVKVDRQEKHTAVQFASDSPYYNEYFVFEFFTTVNNLIDKKVTLNVVRPGSCLRKRRILGFITFDIGTVWYQKDHQCYHKWAILSPPPKDLISGTRGYLKIDLNVLTKGETPKPPPYEQNEEIEGNLFLPEGIAVERQKVNFIFTIYRGANLIKRPSAFEGATSKSDNNPPTAFVEIAFGGLSIKTSVKKSSNPIWNERLIFPELFPPLSQRFQINLYTYANKRNPPKYLNLRSIANGKEEGFLPTFGPSFIHFYAANDLDGYLGKVLISLETKLISEHVAAFPIVEAIASPTLENIMHEETFIVHVTIFEVSSILSKFADKQISFRVACGPILNEGHSLITMPMKPHKTSTNSCFLDIGERKPCLYLKLTLPDLRKRIYLNNMLTKVTAELKNRLNAIESFFDNKPGKEAKAQSETLILETLDFIMSSSVKYVDLASTFDLSDYTQLDSERWKMSLREMRNIHAKASETYCVKSKRKIFQRLEAMHQQLEVVSEAIDDWPNIYIWMVCNAKRVAYYTLPAKSVFFSVVSEEKGNHCGMMQSIFLHDEPKLATIGRKLTKICAKMDVMVWMGMEKHWYEFINSIPDGFEPDSKETIPKWLIATEKHEFQGVVLIFQGRITPGFDSSSLCDPYFRVTIGGQSKQTQTFTKTLNPIWDQALVFSLLLYGSKKCIKANPPVILVEIYDQDSGATSELVGRSTVKPVIRLKDDVLPNAKLTWYPVENSFMVSAEILAAFEVTEEHDVALNSHQQSIILKIPQHLKPNLINHRIEVLFWGVRHLKKVQMLMINKPKIVLECIYNTFSSDALPNAAKNLNYSKSVQIFESIIAQEIEHARCITMKMFDCRCFGINVFAGTHIAPMSNFFYQPLTGEERRLKFEMWEQQSDLMSDTFESIILSLQCREHKKRLEYEMARFTLERFLKFVCRCFWRKKTVKVVFEEDNTFNEEKDFDWWTKFYASLENEELSDKAHFKYKLVVYENELEAQPQFHSFTDMLKSFPMYKGKKTGDDALDETNTTGVFKGSVKIYQWPPVADYVTNSGLPLEKGVFQDFPQNNPLRFVLRVYCVRALNLRPKDNSSSDSYLYLTLNDKTIDDKEHVVNKQLNPVYGRCYEFHGIFPEDHTLTIAVYDHDIWSGDDLIGQTKIDIENRFFTNHRAHCGLAQVYKTDGHCEWRDYQKPASILFDLCRRWNLPDPEYTRTSVRIMEKEFQPKNFKPGQNRELDRQVLALSALRRWQEVPVVGCALVPEHVETRSLYNPNNPGLEQGKLQLWLDIFPLSDLPPPKQVCIEPRKPIDYELRVIIWNCKKLLLSEDDFFTGQKKSDVFVKGWLVSPSEAQCTDVHYRSLSGEANFNWRFVFPFKYLSTENKLVYTEKHLLSSDHVDIKIPCKLSLQIWDYDAFQFDDYLGSISLELSHLPRAVHLSKMCKLKMLQPNAPTVNLFKIKRTKGWWPLKRFDQKKNKFILGGCIEAEFELMLLDDAIKSPAGMGREGPHPLPPPKRPDTSFNFFLNPYKTAKYLMVAHKWRIIKVFFIIILILSTVASLYSLPTAFVHRYIG